MDPAIQENETTSAVPHPFRVRRAVRELHDTVTLELDAVDGAPLRFTPGQFNMLYVFGVGEVPISISGNPVNPEPLVHTTRAVGAVTDAICALKPGAALGVRGPFGVGWPMDGAIGKDVLIVAGGIGLAPLRPAIYQILADRKRYGRVTLLIGARSPRELLYAREIERWRAAGVIDVLVTVDSATDNWHGQVGVVTTLVAGARFEPAETIAMLCGPEVMMRYGAAELLSRGVPGDEIYVSIERNMQCAVGFCGHCQFGPTFVCKDGPVFSHARIEPLTNIREV